MGAIIIKNGRLIYSDFVSNRPEPTSLFELWCLLGGVANLLVVMAISRETISNTPNAAILLALVFPAIFFCLDYLSKEAPSFSFVLYATIVSAMVYCIYAPLFPVDSLRPDFGAYSSILLFCLIALMLKLTKKLRN